MPKRKGSAEDVRKDLKIIKETQRRILSSLDTETIEKAARYDRLLVSLSALNFDVSSVVNTHDDMGNVRVIVNYGRPASEIVVNPAGEVIWDPFASAMNDLGLIGYDGMEKIALAIENALKE